MIRILDKETIDKIAAGEVIERPSSVVKELVENSIDAGATTVTVELKDGGTSMIRVSDNGIGINKEEVRTAYMRHATSKIETAEDLNGIASLGFRGEALSTIAAVSETEMITKTAEELVGTRYVIRGGEELAFSEVGVPEGTTIIVRDLFFNTPARKKFLKSNMTEGSYITDLLTKIALSHPEIAIRLIAGGKTTINTSGNGSAKDVIYQLYGRDVTENLIEISASEGPLSMRGYISRPNINRGNRTLETYFINERLIKSNIINRAIEEGYRTFLMQHQFPFTTLYITLPKEQCDVNVHPTKMEFKYDNEKELFTFVSRAVREALLGKELIPEQKEAESAPAPVTERPVEPFESTRMGSPVTANRMKMYNDSYHMLERMKEEEAAEGEDASDGIDLSKLLDEGGVSYEPSSETPAANASEKAQAVPVPDEIPQADLHRPPEAPVQKPAEEPVSKLSGYDRKGQKVTYEQTGIFEEHFLTQDARKDHRVIGQVFGTYWLIEYDNSLYIMDQHAAHEKINYEELMKNLAEKKILSQQLLPPMIVTLSYTERQAVLDNFDLFIKMGYDIEEFGGNELKINAVPSNLFGIHSKDMFMEFIGSLVDNSGYMSNEVFIRKLASMACKAAIKGNTRITFEEANDLIDKLLKLENPYTCPHGRPTIITVTEKELEKRFKRIV